MTSDPWDHLYAYVRSPDGAYNWLDEATQAIFELIRSPTLTEWGVRQEPVRRIAARAAHQIPGPSGPAADATDDEIRAWLIGEVGRQAGLV